MFWKRLAMSLFAEHYVKPGDSKLGVFSFLILKNLQQFLFCQMAGSDAFFWQYLIRQSLFVFLQFQDVYKRQRLFSLASIGTITACLFIFGIFYCMVMNFQHIFSEVETTVGVTVFFNEGVEENQILDIKSQIEQREEVDNVHYTSPEEAWEEYKEKALSLIHI